HPGVQGNPPTPEAMAIDQRVHFAGELRLCQRLDDNIALPCAITPGLPMLNRGAAADGKMRAKRRDPLRACALNREQAAAVGRTGYGSNRGRLATGRVR